MNFCFIQPPSSLLLEDKVMIPLGICYLSAWAQKHGHQASIIDLAGVDDLIAKMKQDKQKIDNADIIGITATTPQYHLAQQINAYIKATARGKPVVCGGIHLTSLVHANEMNFLQRDGFDSYVIGEGYNAITRMADDLKEGQIKKMYSEPILKDVNELPYAARDLIDFTSYKYYLGDTMATTMYTQYGCPYACQYCESPMAGSYTVRAMTPQRIQDEIRYIRDTWGVYGFMFFR